MAFHAFVTADGADSHDPAHVDSREYPHQETAWLDGLGVVLHHSNLEMCLGPVAQLNLI